LIRAKLRAGEIAYADATLPVRNVRRRTDSSAAAVTKSAFGALGYTAKNHWRVLGSARFGRRACRVGDPRWAAV
jgi:hypothetical protein